MDMVLTACDADDWSRFAQEDWGLKLCKYPILASRSILPEPLEYDVLHSSLMEMDDEDRRVVLQHLCCYQGGTITLKELLQTIQPLSKRSISLASMFNRKSIERYGLKQEIDSLMNGQIKINEQVNFQALRRIPPC